MYVQNIVKHYTNMAECNEMPYELVDTIFKMKGKIGKSLFKEVAQALETASFKARIPDPKTFTAYLPTTNTTVGVQWSSRYTTGASKSAHDSEPLTPLLLHT
jgi:hypothetical protein